MEILHVSAECYPVAKVGGLADVVGALPKYQNKIGHHAQVVMPMYRTVFLQENQWDVVHKGAISFGGSNLEFTVIKEGINNRAKLVYEAQLWNLLTDKEKKFSLDLGVKYNYDIVSIVRDLTSPNNPRLALY